MNFSQRAVEAAAEAVRECRDRMAASFDSPDPTEIAYDEFLARAALTAALAVDGVALQGWQEIESAPVEQPIDILCQDTDEQHHRFCDATIIDREPHAFTFIDTNGKHTYFPHENGMWPTHWMPLPRPPAASEGEKRNSPPQDKS